MSHELPRPYEYQKKILRDILDLKARMDASNVPVSVCRVPSDDPGFCERIDWMLEQAGRGKLRDYAQKIMDRHF